MAAVVVVSGALVTGAPPAGANDDPHRFYVAAEPFDIVGVCPFPVHVDIVTNREYATETDLADGTVVLEITGSLVWRLTNTETGESRTYNISGPGTVTIDGSVWRLETRGLGLFYVTNGADFGLPNLLYASGPFAFTTDTATDTIVSVERSPHVKEDVCETLA